MGAFAFFGSVIAILASLGVYGLLKNYISTSIDEALRGGAVAEFVSEIEANAQRASLGAEKLDSILVQAQESQRLINEIIANTKQFRVVSGCTDISGSGWKDYGKGIMMEINTEDHAFQTTPIYLTSLRGDTDHWLLVGTSSIYEPTPQGFKIYLRYADDSPLNAERACQRHWCVQWIALERREIAEAS
jgi:hypothetical protein